MLILHAKGQTCNKFFIYLAYMGDSIESGEKIVILSPDITIRDYPNLYDSKILKFPCYFKKFEKIIAYNTYFKLMYALENKYTLKFLSIFFRLIPQINVVIANAGFNKSKNHLKYAVELKKMFTPRIEIKSEVESVFMSVRAKSKIIIGVHIRYGDYKFWNEGKYYYSIAQYHKLMLNIKNLFRGYSVAFFISSNEKIDLSVFTDCNCFIIPNSTSTKDLFGLGLSDYIIGPPSTFSGWASYYANTPLYFIENPDEEITISSFKNILEIWE